MRSQGGDNDGLNDSDEMDLLSLLVEGDLLVRKKRVTLVCLGCEAEDAGVLVVVWIVFGWWFGCFGESIVDGRWGL